MTCPFRWSLASGLGLILVSSVSAQTGAIAGKVTDSSRAQPLAGAHVVVRDPTGGIVGSASTAASGSYRVVNLPAGRYSVTVSAIAFAPKRYDGVEVPAGGAATLDAVLVAQILQLDELTVTTVSRVPEKITEAPASITVIPTVQIQERPATTVIEHLKAAPGVTISQGGLVQSNVVARGFNNIFSGALLTLIDNRYASVPSLRVNVPAFFPVTNDDIEQIEFVLGPGAALYGPNVSNGVLHIITKSPLTSTGTTVSLEGGLRAGSRPVPGFSTITDDGAGLVRLGIRHASRLSPKVGFKVSGEYFKGVDWRYADPGDTLSPGSTQATRTICRGPGGCRDFDVVKWNGEARIDVKPNAHTEWITSYGRTQAENLIELTGIGAGQARDWRYQHIHSRFRFKELFIQGFGNFSNAGNTFLLRDGNPIVDDSRLWAAQAQHGTALGSRETLIYGVDFIFTDARTGGTINGSNEADDDIKEIGGYLHSVTRFGPRFDLVGAVRVDKHSRLEDPVVSPRLALVFKPEPDQNLRVTYNRAFSTPSNNNLFLDIAAGTAGPYTVRALGVPKDGFHFRLGGGCAGGIDNLCMRTPFPGVPPNALLPARATALWSVAVGVMLANPQVPASAKQLLQATQAPTTQVGTQLRALNPTTRTFFDIPATQVRDIERIKPSISNTLEAGYKGDLGGKARLSIDVYYEHRENFVGPLIVETPNVFLDRASLIAYLTQQWTPLLGGNAAQAQALAGAIGTAMAGLPNSQTTPGIPLGTVVPNDGGPLTSRPDVFLTYRNFGEVDLFGSDVAIDYIADDRWSIAATYSLVNKDFFTAEEVKGPTDIALNASKSRGSATLRFRNDPQGWATEARFRYVKGFPVNSGVYVSPQRSDGSFEPTDSYGVIDVQGSIRPRFGARNMLVSLAVTNVLNKAYATFVGVPKLGRMVMTKVSYTF